MKARNWLSLVVATIGLWALSPGAAGVASPAWAQVDSGVAANVQAIIQAAHLAEPLVATAPTSPAEDLALSHALAIYEQRAKPDDASALDAFLAAYPRSGWAAALQTNLGLSDLHYGYFSRALDAWKTAWAEGKNAAEPRARALVDRAVGELAQLYASLGHNDELTALFADIGDRAVTGSATEMVQRAREELTQAATDPRHLFICGPLALRSLMINGGVNSKDADALQWYRAGPNGTNLAEVGKLADQAEFPHRLVFRQPGQPVPMPSIVHWKLGHFATIVGEANGLFHVEDSVFGGSGLWVTRAALDAEASGYFLVAADTPANDGWRAVGDAEAASVWGKGPSVNGRPGDAGDPPANPPSNCPLCGYNIAESSVSVTLADTPVGYSPPIGPSAKVRISYNQREDSQPANFNFFNVSAKWTLNWLTYVTDDPANPGANVTRYLSGGGAFYYLGYNSATGQFAAQDTDGSVLTLVSQSPVTYRRQLRDGSVEIYTQSDGTTAYPRNIFLSQSIDPQGNSITLAYDGQQRLVSLTDATGRQTSFTYGLSGRPLLVTQVTDPFGRSATLGYDPAGRLSSITDILGLTSSFTYDANSLVNSLTTPYGVTSFAYTAPGASGPPRFVDVTDPLGYHEREEWLEPAPIPDSDPAATVPQGMPVPPTNQYLTYRDSFHWDKNAYIVAGCTPTGGCDYTKARDTHFAHMPNTNLKSTTIESIKYPLENRIWYTYPGQSNPPGSLYAGTYNQPIAIGRVLDDGTTQLKQFSYNTEAFNLTQTIDPVGRTTQYTYAANQTDLLAITQTTANGMLTPVAQFTYNNQHRPLASTDASGQTTKYSYNAVGQLASSTNPLNQTTAYQYDLFGNLISVVNANGAVAASFTYDSYARIETYTDSEGWTSTYSYDAANRVTAITYPDSTADRYSYDRLDLSSYLDREGKLWLYSHDVDRRLTSMTDPRGQQTFYAYNGAGKLTSLTDAKGAVTNWTYDVEGRLTSKQYPDTSTASYAYEMASNRLHAVTDALGQVKQFTYALDNAVTSISYLNAVNATPNINFTFDPYFPRITSMNDGNGVTRYSYAAPFSLGALLPEQECFTPSGGMTCSYQINYAYDALGRPSSRTVAGSSAESFQYDAIGRETNHTSDLGSFTLSYLGQTGQITQRQLGSSSLDTTWSYLPNSGDRRLSQINNVGLSSSQFSTYQFTTTPENFISAVTESSEAGTAYPAPATQAASFNNLNQLTILSGQSLTYDAVGNLLSDGQRNYAWDAENRLVGITYPGQSGKVTSFAYDGFGRRTSISSTPAGGGSAVTTSYIWCGGNICQSRNSSNLPLREYFAEGEFLPGSPGVSYYYGPDQIGSVRRVFVNATSASAYSYDPYGNPLQGTPPLADFSYGGMFYNADSGLYLAQNRVYDPVASRWLSRDPTGEMSDPSFNLYRYVYSNPISLIDPTGYGPFGAAVGGVIGGTIAGALGAETGPADLAISFAGRQLGKFIGSGLEDALNGILPSMSNGDDLPSQTGDDSPVQSGNPGSPTCPGDVVAPGGVPIGEPNGNNPNVRNLPGADPFAKTLYNDLAAFGNGVSNSNYPGPNTQLPDGGFVGYRSALDSGSGVPAVDVNIPGVFSGKFHFP